jgi:hypothetical protein
MTDHPSALVSVPPHALEAIAFNLCSLHDFDPAFVRENERVAKAAITEYLRATPAPAAPQAAGVGEREAIARCIDPLAFSEKYVRWTDPAWAEKKAKRLADAVAKADAILALRAPSREPEGGAVSIWSDARSMFVRYAELFAMTERYEEASAIADKAAREIEALTTREEAPAVPDDVQRLVNAARVVAFEDQGPDALKALDVASEAFADRVPWENEPGEEAPAEAGDDLRAQVVKLLDELIAHIVAIGPDKPDMNTPMCRRVWREVFADLILALRAQPQAREDAQPVAWREVFIADEEDGPVSGICIDMADGSQVWTGECSNAMLDGMGDERPDESGQFVMVAMKGNPTRVVASVSNVDDGIEIARSLASRSTHPAPDALREDSPAWTALADLVSWFTKPVQGQNGMVWVIPAGEQGADDAVNAARAALQAEGGVA